VPRPIRELIAAMIAGEPLTEQEAARLRRRRPRERFWPYLLAGFSMVEAVHKMRAEILHDLPHYTLPQCRYRIRALVHLAEEQAAAWEGRRRADARHEIERVTRSVDARHGDRRRVTQ
jgi:hypothetical protein